MSMLEILNKKTTQIMLALVAGITLGALFYPQSHTEERIRQQLIEEYAVKEQEKQKEYDKLVSENNNKIDKIEESYKTSIEQSQQTIQKLTIENSSLKQSIKKKKLKIVKPDGTIVEQEVEESNTEQTQTVITQVREEFTRKVQEIETKWKKVHEERIAKLTSEYQKELEKARSETKTIEVLVEKEKTVDVNPKKLRPEIGATSKKDFYVHGTYSAWGPVFIGGGISGTKNSFGEARIGVGVDF